MKKTTTKTSKTKKTPRKLGFTEFFLHATPAEKKRVFLEAARRANADQRRLLGIAK